MPQPTRILRRTSSCWVHCAALLVAAAAALVFAWSDPVAAGDLRPSPDAVEYALDASQLAAFRLPVVRVGEVAAPPRYPLGLPLLAAPAFWLPSRAGAPEPFRAALAITAAAVAAAIACAWTAHRAYGAVAGGLALLLVALSPFYQQYARVVMAEMPSAAVFSGVALALTFGRSAPLRTSMLCGALFGVAVWLRLASVQALPALALALWALPGRRRLAAPGTAALAALLLLLPLLALQSALYGAPWRTGYHVWTPEWAGGVRPVFSFAYVSGPPALPSRAVQSNTVHYLAAWLGLAARGDGGEPVGSPVHPAAAGALALAALAGTVRGVRDPATRPAALFASVGVLCALGFFAVYYYQDVRFLAPWAPLWLCLGAGGLTWPLAGLAAHSRGSDVPVARRGALGGAGVVALAVGAYALLPVPAALAATPAWTRAVRHQPSETPPRLSQLRALAGTLPHDAWLISTLDAPLVDYYLLHEGSRRYLPLARGLEFVDKPLLRSIPAATDLPSQIRQHVSAGSVVALDRWSLEFAEGLPDYRRELDRVVAGYDLVPGDSPPESPAAPIYYALALPSPGHHLERYHLAPSTPIRGSGPDVYLYTGSGRWRVPSLDAFTQRGLRWEDVRRLPDSVLAGLPDVDSPVCCG